MRRDRRRPRRWARAVVATACLAGVLVGPAAVPGAGALTPGGFNVSTTPPPSRPVAATPPAPLWNIDRDGALSVPLHDGRTLWTFADTTTRDPATGAVIGFTTHATAAIDVDGSGRVREATTGGIPHDLLPLVGGCRPDELESLWPASLTSVRATGATDVLIYYEHVCTVRSQLGSLSGSRSLGMGLARWRYTGQSPTTPIRATVVEPRLFEPATQWNGARAGGYGLASFHDPNDGFVYVYECRSTLARRCRVARVQPSWASQANAYRYWDGTAWSSGAGAAVDLTMPGDVLGGKGAAAWSPELRRYLWVEQNFPSASALVRWADRPEGPWSPATVVELPECQPTPTDGFACRAVDLHASYTDAGSIGIGFYSGGMAQPVRLVQVPVLTSPLGFLDGVRALPGVVDVRGWALDPDTTAPVEVHVYVGSTGWNLGPASASRPDVGAAHPGYGDAHGFNRLLPAPPGTHQVCAIALDAAAPGGNTVLGCRTVTVPGGSPFGVLDAARGGPDGTLSVRGWAIDPDVTIPAEVHVYAGGVGWNLGAAAVLRPDVGAAHPGYGDAHGFDATLHGAPPGPVQVCAYGIDVAGRGGNSLLGCRQAVVPTGSPFGFLDVAQAGPGRTATVGGWAIDPDTTGPVEVHAYIGPAGWNLGPATAPRPDVAAAVPGYGPAHGFARTLEGVPAGTHRACAYALDAGGTGGTTVLGCRTIVVT